MFQQLPGDPFFIDTFLSGDLTTETAQHVYSVDFQPDVWVINSNLSAGKIQIFAGNGTNGTPIQVSTHVVRLPLKKMDSLTVNTIGATGWYEVIAIKGLDGFDIHK